MGFERVVRCALDRIQVFTLARLSANRLDEDGWSPLHYAAYHGHEEVNSRTSDCVLAEKKGKDERGKGRDLIWLMS